MLAEAPRPFFCQDTGIPSGVPSIQDQAALSVGGERSENQQEQQTNPSAVSEIPPCFELIRQFISQIARMQDDIEIHEQKMPVVKDEPFALRLIETKEGYAVDSTLSEEHYLVVGTSKNTMWPGRDYSLRFTRRDEERVDDEQVIKDIGFIDPYNNRRMSELEITLADTPEKEYRYQLSILARYDDDDNYERSLIARYDDKTPLKEGQCQRVTFYVPNSDESTTLLPEEIKIGIDTGIYYWDFDARDAILLSGDVDAHTKALVDFADSIIPQVNPQLPEPTVEGEK